MVTTNLSNVASSFETIAERRDIKSLAAIGFAGAGGGILATELSDYVLPILGVSGTPSTGVEFGANAGVKALVGLGLGYAALEVGGLPGAALGLAGLGAVVVAGADAVSAGQRFVFSGQQALAGGRVAASGNARSAGSRTASKSTASASSGNSPATGSSGPAYT